MEHVTQLFQSGVEKNKGGYSVYILKYDFGTEYEFNYELELQDLIKGLNAVTLHVLDVDDIYRNDKQYFDDYYDELLEYFYKQAYEAWEQVYEEQQNPYAYRGINRKDYE